MGDLGSAGGANFTGSDQRTSVDKAIAVLKAFGQDGGRGLGVSELARRAGLSKSTSFRLLGMLERNGMIERVGVDYRIGDVLHELSAPSGQALDHRITNAVSPFLAELYAQTQRTVQLAVLRDAQVVYLNKLEGRMRLRSPSRIGGRMPAYATGVGKAMLAHDRDAVEATLRRPRRSWTSRTLVEEDDLLMDLQRVRASGISLDAGECLEQLACIAVPVFGPQRAIVAALSISADDSATLIRDYSGLLRRIGREASVVVTRALSTAA